MVCPHGPLEAHMVGRCRLFHAIFAFGQHTWSDDVWHGMPSSPLIAHMVIRHRAWHDIITLGHDTRSDYGGRGIPSSPLNNTQVQDMSGVACYHHHWNEHLVGRCRVWHAIIAVWLHRQGRMTSYVRCLHLPWTAHTVRPRRAWHASMTFGRHIWSHDVG